MTQWGLSLEELTAQFPKLSLRPERVEQTFFAKFSPIWWLPEGLVSVLPNLDIRQGVIAGRAASHYRPTDVWGKKLLVEAYKGPSNDPRKAGMTLFVAMYMWELKKPQTGPHTMHFYEKPEKTKACTSN